MAHGRLIDLTHLLLLAGDGPDRIAEVLSGLIAPAHIKDTLNQGPAEGGAVHAALTEVGAATFRQHETIRHISAALYRLHPTNERLLIREAELAMQAGIHAEGRDRTEHFKDAHGLLRRVADNPVSGRDYTLRFNLGWLSWQLGEPLAGVEEAFYQAARLSAATAPPFHEYCLRHLAYLQYLDGKYTDAYDTAAKAVQQYPESLDARYEAARYAARVGKVDETQAHLDHCFSGSLVYLLYAAAENDFEAEGGSAPALIASTVERARRDLELSLRAWRGALRVVREAEEKSGLTVALSGLDEATQQAADERYVVLSRKDPFGVASLHRAVTGKPEAVLAATEAALAGVVDACQSEINRLRRQLQKLVDDLELWNAALEQLEDEARTQGYVLRTDAAGGSGFLLWSTKRQQKVQSARISYISCLQNLDVAERHYTEQSPPLEKAIADVEAKQERVRTALEWLRAQSTTP